MRLKAQPSGHRQHVKKKASFQAKKTHPSGKTLQDAPSPRGRASAFAAKATAGQGTTTSRQPLEEARTSSSYFWDVILGVS